ncbi:MAG TPA: GNAT family protein [Chitinophagaceae bacterium]|jgi:ribosomal-protein-alanine N-acetyltransferase|nr:GNAT family protein [Chitinophagaceae bacterium]
MFPQLSTNRFLLQQIKSPDQQFIFKGLSHPEVIPYYGVHYDSFEATAAQIEWYEKIWNERTGCWWKIVNKETNEPIGACGMNYYNVAHEKAEIGYWLLPEYWGQGAMSEVWPVVLDHLFSNWKLHRLEAVVEEGNASSTKLSEKLGFKYEGTLRASEIKNGKRLNLLMYSLLATDR